MRDIKVGRPLRFRAGKVRVVGAGDRGYAPGVRTLFLLLSPFLLLAAKAPEPAPPTEAEIPALAVSFAERIAPRKVFAPDGKEVPLSTLLDATRVEHCLRTIGQASAWPATWLIVQDMTRPYDLVLRVVRGTDGAIADPDPAYLVARREWDDAALEAAVREATGAKPAGGRSRNVVVQSFTSQIATTYVYDLPKTGKDAKWLLALLPEGSLLRESTSIDLGDGRRHMIAVVLERPKFVPADCATPEGRKRKHHDDGGIVIVLAGESALEDRLDVTETVRSATGQTMLPRFACAAGDETPGAIDKLVDAKFEGREPVRLLSFTGREAQSELTGASIVVGVKKTDGAFKLFARPLTK